MSAVNTWAVILDQVRFEVDDSQRCQLRFKEFSINDEHWPNGSCADGTRETNCLWLLTSGNMWRLKSVQKSNIGSPVKYAQNHVIHVDTRQSMHCSPHRTSHKLKWDTMGTPKLRSACVIDPTHGSILPKISWKHRSSLSASCPGSISESSIWHIWSPKKGTPENLYPKPEI